jgi:hypothetical protein
MASQLKERSIYQSPHGNEVMLDGIIPGKDLIDLCSDFLTIKKPGILIQYSPLILYHHRYKIATLCLTRTTHPDPGMLLTLFNTDMHSVQANPTKSAIAQIQLLYWDDNALMSSTAIIHTRTHTEIVEIKPKSQAEKVALKYSVNPNMIILPPKVWLELLKGSRYILDQQQIPYPKKFQLKWWRF